MLNKLSICAAAIISLAACGGSSGGAGGDVALPFLPPTGPAGSFNALLNTEATLLNRFYDTNGRAVATPSAQVPNAGTATFTGTAAFPASGRQLSIQTVNNATSISRSAPQLAARAVMTADFANGNVSGTIDQFRDAANTALPGSLTLGAAAINGARYNGGTVSGTYPVNGTAQTVGNVSHGGTFVGPNADGIAGDIGFIAPTVTGGQQLVTGTLLVGR